MNLKGFALLRLGHGYNAGVCGRAAFRKTQPGADVGHILNGNIGRDNLIAQDVEGTSGSGFASTNLTCCPLTSTS
jgi:hypothetical protein